MFEYEELQRRLGNGWNTWNTRSVLSHVLLPHGFAINLGLKEYAANAQLHEALIGRQGEEVETIVPGMRTYDGRYTELELHWRGITCRIQSCTDGDDQLILITPLVNSQLVTPLLTVTVGMLWNRDGMLARQEDTLVGIMPGNTIQLFATGSCVIDPYITLLTPYLALPLDQSIGIATGRARSLAEIEACLAERRVDCASTPQQFCALSELYAAMQTCLAWDTIYDPLGDRVVSPVSRIWSSSGGGWGGYVLFCWDSYFAGFMAALDNKALAYANVVEITREKTEAGFVPNYGAAGRHKSYDRSQPPVGSAIVWELYRRFGDRWLLEEVFADLLAWNRWWLSARISDDNGLLAWGSTPYPLVTGDYFETAGVNANYGGALESGLDNSPMYDDIPFDTERHQLLLADVGLNSLYIWDCTALANIADALEQPAIATELRQRAADYTTKIQTLWDDNSGLFLNRRTDTGEFSPRLSPTHFYPLLAGAATPEQAARMIDEHFFNPDEFWGEWMLPSIARNDPAFPDQDYWRGRIWAPMNFLVYLGLCRYDLPEARRALVEKSTALLLKEWRANGHVHENYSAITGDGCDSHNSDRFYHWGGLLSLIAFLDAGYFTSETNCAYEGRT